MGSGYAGLLGGAGAASGLETLLARRLAQAKFAEQKRSTLADETLKGQSIDATDSAREASLNEAQRYHDLTAGNASDLNAIRLEQLKQGGQMQRMREQGLNDRNGESMALKQEIADHKNQQDALMNAVRSGQLDAEQGRLALAQSEQRFRELQARLDTVEQTAAAKAKGAATGKAQAVPPTMFQNFMNSDYNPFKKKATADPKIKVTRIQ